MPLILGVGPGTFAVLLTAAIALVVFVTAAWLKPDRLVPIFVVCLAAPFVVLGLIYASPPVDYAVGSSVDYFYPVRVSALVVGILALAFGLFAQIVMPVLLAPPYVAPRSSCRRRVLEVNHPSWMK